jgi:hypothetical protein
VNETDAIASQRWHLFAFASLDEPTNRSSETNQPMPESLDLIFAAPQDIRYVAIFLGGTLVSFSKPTTVGASSSESDEYEELIINPTLLTLVQQRGNIPTQRNPNCSFPSFSPFPL